jgi:hypothetical protein
MAIAQSKVSNTLSNVYSSSGSTAITVMFFMNNGATPATLSLALMAGSATPTIADNGIMKDVTVEAGDTYIFDTEKLVLEDTDALWAVSDTADAIVATITYAEL